MPIWTRTLLAAGLLVLVPNALANSQRLAFNVTGLLSSQGQLRAMLCEPHERFPNGCKRRLSVPAKAEGTELVFGGLTPGRYALSVVHDEDNSGKLGVSAVSGRPKPFGFSNNVTGPGGVPSFNLAAVTLRENLAAPVQTVRMRAQGAGR